MPNAIRLKDGLIEVYSSDGTVPVMVDMTNLGFPGVLVHTTIEQLSDARKNLKRTMLHEKVNMLYSLQAACEQAHRNIERLYNEKGETWDNFMNDLMILATLMEDMFGKKIDILKITSKRTSTLAEAQLYE